MSSSALSKNGTQASEIDLRLSELNDTVAVSEIFFSLTGLSYFSRPAIKPQAFKRNLETNQHALTNFH